MRIQFLAVFFLGGNDLYDLIKRNKKNVLVLIMVVVVIYFSVWVVGAGCRAFSVFHFFLDTITNSIGDEPEEFAPCWFGFFI